MRRLGAIAALVLGGAATLFASAAGADDVHRYRIELDNAFGIYEGSQVRVAGVTAGTVQSLSITPEKRAAAEIELSGELAGLGTETTCSSEPQSLIAEYFLDCQPKGPPLAEGGTIPVEQTTQTVQPDLLQATFREPYRERLSLIVNEFGTALAGNPEELNAAIRRGAPALGEFDELLAKLAERNGEIRGMVVDSERVLEALAARRQDITRFIREARDVASAGAERRTDLSRDVELLDDLLVELRPTLVELGEASRVGTPLLASLRRSASELDRFGGSLPGFADSSKTALTALGEASVPGRRAVAEGADEVGLLRRFAKRAPGTSEPLKDLLRDIDDPRRVVEIDKRAARSCDDETRSCWASGRDAPTGYTGMEGLLNYIYYLAGATNQVDQLSHLLHVNIYSTGDVGNPCGGTFWTGGKPGTPEFGVPAKDGGLTTDIRDAHACVSWLGKNQAGLNFDVGLPPYDPSVCPQGSDAPELCDPAGTPRGAAGRASGGRAQSQAVPGASAAPDTPGQASGADSPLAPLPPSQVEGLEDLLGLPEEGLGRDEAGTEELLDFLFGS